MKRALKKRVKAVLKNTPSSDGVPVEQVNVTNPKVNRRVRTKAAMIGLAISVGATGLLVTRQSDQAQAAAPVGSQKATSSIPAVPKTEVKFASTKLESQAVSLTSVPENPVIVEPTAVSQVPGLEARWQVAASGMSVQVPASAAFSPATAVYKKSSYPVPQVGQGVNSTLSKTVSVVGSKDIPLKYQPQTVAASGITTDEINAQLKAQQEFALNRLQEKSNRLRKSLAELRSGETKNLSQAGIGLTQPTTVTQKTVIAQVETSSPDASRANLISRLKQQRDSSMGTPQALTPAPARPTVIASSSLTPYEVKPGDTLVAIAISHGTSVTELAKVNNLTNPNQLQISQKLVIPATQVEPIATTTFVESNTTAKVATPPVTTFVESNTTPKVATSPLNTAGINLNLSADSQLPIIADNSNVNASTLTTANNQNQTDIPTPTKIVPTTPASYGMGGETPAPRPFAQLQLPKKPANRVASVNNNERLESLQAEIHRLQARYRAQQSGNLVVPAISETSKTAAVPIPVASPNNFSRVSNSASRPSNLAIPIPVPTPIVPSYSAQPIKPQFRAIRPVDEPVNPEFSSNQAAYRNPSASPRFGTPLMRVNSSDSLGKIRGTTVSPQLPPLAAVDQYLPKPIDETISPPSTTSVSYIWPAKGVLTSGYGMRWGKMHRGIDIANSTGTPIVASSGGVVEKAGWNKGGYGNLVDIRHADGSLTRYGHNSKILVRSGQQVHQGETIALLGSTGFSTGPHSHFEIHPTGKGAVNPIAMLQARL